MTVSSTAARLSYSGDGVSTTFAVPYFIKAADLNVYVDDALKALTSDYSAAGAGLPAGGSVTFTAAPGPGTAVTIIRNPDTLQSTKLPSNDPFPSRAVETALDKLTMLAQRNNDLLARAIVLPDPYAGGAVPSLPPPGAGKFLRWNAPGTALEAVDATTSTLGDFLQSGAGAVARGFTSKVGEIVSVKDFGAVGDGVTDDTAAIQAAIASLAGTIHFPDGTYITSATIRLVNNNQILQGAGRSRTTIAADFRGGAVVQIERARCSIFDMAISTKAGSARRAASPLGVTPPSAAVGGNSTDHGIVILETSSPTTYATISRVDTVYQPAFGLALFGSGTGTVIDQVGVTSCGGHGMYLDNGGKLGTTLGRNGIVDIRSCIIQSCWGAGLSIGVGGPNTSYRVRVTNCDIFSNAVGDGGTNQPAFYAAGGAEIEANCEQLLLDSCAVGFNARGINIGLSNSVMITNCRFVSITTRGILINPDCHNIRVNNAYAVGAMPAVGFRVQDRCNNVEINGIVSQQWGLSNKVYCTNVANGPFTVSSTINFSGGCVGTITGVVTYSTTAEITFDYVSGNLPQAGETITSGSTTALTPFDVNINHTIIDSESNTNVLINNKRAVTVPGRNELFFLDGLHYAIAASGYLNVRSALCGVIGAGDVTGTVSYFRFAPSVEVPNGLTSVVYNWNSYNINLQDKSIVGNLECQGTTAVLQPNKGLEFVSNRGTYYAIGRAVA